MYLFDDSNLTHYMIFVLEYLWGGFISL